MVTEGQRKQRSEQSLMGGIHNLMSKCRSQAQQVRLLDHALKMAMDGEIPVSGPPKEDPRQMAIERLAEQKLRLEHLMEQRSQEAAKGTEVV